MERITQQQLNKAIQRINQGRNHQIPAEESNQQVLAAWAVINQAEQEELETRQEIYKKLGIDPVNVKHDWLSEEQGYQGATAVITGTANGTGLKRQTKRPRK